MIPYKEQEKLRYCKQQTHLTQNGIEPNTFKYSIITENIDFNTKVVCPFCLTENFLYSFPKNFGLRICTICGNKVVLRTLTKKMTTEEFAKWVYDYRLNGFWQKVYPNFKEWNRKLKELGLSYDFWEYYNKFKGISKISEELGEKENEYY